jgi:hypothetical protein
LACTGSYGGDRRAGRRGFGHGEGGTCGGASNRKCGDAHIVCRGLNANVSTCFILNEALFINFTEIAD